MVSRGCWECVWKVSVVIWRVYRGCLEDICMMSWRVSEGFSDGLWRVSGVSLARTGQVGSGQVRTVKSGWIMSGQVK